MKSALCLLPLALLAACDSSPTIEAKNASVADVAEKVRDAGGTDEYLRAGKWLTKATLEELSAPGMPPGIADNMKLTMANKPGTETCMTEADVKKPNADFFAGKTRQLPLRPFQDGRRQDRRQNALLGGRLRTQLISN